MPNEPVKTFIITLSDEQAEALQSAAFRNNKTTTGFITYCVSLGIFARQHELSGGTIEVVNEDLEVNTLCVTESINTGDVMFVAEDDDDEEEAQ